MEYELYNNYEDKLNVLRTQNRLIDELQLSSRIPKLHIRDAATEEKVVNFYKYINSYNPKATQIVVANLHGPGDRWIRILNSLD